MWYDYESGIPYLWKLGNKIKKIYKDLSFNSKYVVYIIKSSKCKEIHIGSTQVLNIRISLHKSSIKITGNGNLNVSKHQYECSKGI